MPVTDELVHDAAATLGVTVVRPLKQGGQKTVLLATRDADTVVLKVISIGSSMPDALARARREVELLQTVEHPNVVSVASDLVEIGEPAHGAAWLEEFLEGDDLGDVLGDKWDWPDVLAMATDVASGLGALHAVKVVHRDVSANNIRRLPDGRHVVMDPGFARHTERSRLTVGGQPGTPGFMSPEHLLGYSGAPTAASDVFSVGILMFIALTGEQPIPFRGDPADYVRRLSAVETADLAALRPDLESEALAVVARCLHPQPGRRYRNGEILAQSLRELSSP